MSGSASQALDDADDLPAAPPPTWAVRAQRALRTAPVVLVRGVRMPAYAETGTSVVLHGLRMLPMRSGGDAGKELKATVAADARHRVLERRRLQIPAGTGGGSP